MALTLKDFRRVCAEWATGVAVVTCCAPDGEPHGLTVNSFTSVSATPPLVLVCIDHESSVLPVFRTARQFAVNILRVDQQELSTRFAQLPEGRFEGVAWMPGKNGAPLIDDALATLECETRTVIDQGDHAIFVGEAERGTIAEGHPLLFFRSHYGVI